MKKQSDPHQYLQELPVVLRDALCYVMNPDSMLYWTQNPEVDSAAIVRDGDTHSLEIDKKFFCALSEPEQRFLIWHELSHVVAGHITPEFANVNNPIAMNIAMDCVVNRALLKLKYYEIKMPDGGITPQWLHDTLAVPLSLARTGTVWQIYEAIKDQINASAHGSTSGRVHTTPQAPSAARQQAQAGAERQRTASSGNDGDSSIMQDLEGDETRMTLRRILAHLMVPRQRDEQSYRRPSRREQPGFIMPSLKMSDKLCCVIYIDVSSSMSLSVLKCIQYAIDQCKHKATVIYFNTALYTKPRYGGGTDFEPVFEHINKSRRCKHLLITDGQAEWPEGLRVDCLITEQAFEVPPGACKKVYRFEEIL